MLCYERGTTVVNCGDPKNSGERKMIMMMINRNAEGGMRTARRTKDYEVDRPT